MIWITDSWGREKIPKTRGDRRGWEQPHTTTSRVCYCSHSICFALAAVIILQTCQKKTKKKNHPKTCIFISVPEDYTCAHHEVHNLITRYSLRGLAGREEWYHSHTSLSPHEDILRPRGPSVENITTIRAGGGRLYFFFQVFSRTR